MKERIMEFLRKENKSAAQFAEEIDVQPSGISHILSGRNNPSYDFIIKILNKYPKLNAEWLLLGHGAMYKSIRQTSIFDEVAEHLKSPEDKTDLSKPSVKEPVNIKNI